MGVRSAGIGRRMPAKAILAAFFFAAACIALPANPACSEAKGGGWVRETEEILDGLIARRGEIQGAGAFEYHDGIWVSPEWIASLGDPAYRCLIGTVTLESSYALSFFSDKLPRVITGELSKAVPFGGAQLILDGAGTDGSAKAMLTQASAFLPSRWLGWIAYLNGGRGIAVRRSPRGEYRAGRIMTNNLRTSLHELVHAYEDKPFASFERKLKLAFYDKRTEGKKLRRLGRITNLYFYGHGEQYRAGFIWPYLGKDGGAELMSAGLECLMWNRFDVWNRDPELVKFLLGLLIFFGRG